MLYGNLTKHPINWSTYVRFLTLAPDFNFLPTQILGDSK